MHEHHSHRPHPGSVLLDIGGDTGALIIYTQPDLHGREIEVSRPGIDAKRVHTEVLERRINNQPVYAAVFAALPEGDYKIYAFDPTQVDAVSIQGGSVAEVDWRG
jgi:hypothetical protein